MSFAMAAFVVIVMMMSVAFAMAAFVVIIVMVSVAFTVAAFVVIVMMMSMAFTVAAFMVIVMMVPVTFAVAAFVAVIVMMVSAAFAVFVVVAATATAFLAAEQIDEGFYLFVCGRTGNNDRAGEMYSVAGKRIVQVHTHLVVAHFKHMAHETLSVFVHEGYVGAGVNLLAVETAVHAKCGNGEINDMLLFVGTVGIFGFEGEIERISFFERFHMLFESLERKTHSADKLERMFGRGFFGGYHISLLVDGFAFVGGDDSLIHKYGVFSRRVRIDWRVMKVPG